MTTEPLHDDCLHDALYRATFYPTGYFVEVATDEYEKLFGETYQLLQVEKFFDPSEGYARLRDAVLHEVCHYLQFTTTSLGCLHLALTMAAAQLVIDHAGLYKIAAALGKKERVPSQLLRFVKPTPGNSRHEDLCQRAAKAVTNLWKGVGDTRPTIYQVNDLQALVQATIDLQTAEGQILGATLGTIDASGEPTEPISGALAFKWNGPIPSLLCGDLEDLEILEPDGNGLIIVSTLDLLESHARIMEEYITLIAQAHNWQAHPWAADREYRSSQVLGRYGRTRHLVTNALSDHEFMRKLANLAQNGILDFADKEILHLYLHLLEVQLLVHDVALMVPLSVENRGTIPWTSFSPLERFNTGLRALKDWTMLGVGMIRGYQPWFKVADLMTARIGGPSYSETVKRLVLILTGDLGLILPHLKQAAELRSEIHPYLSIFQVLQKALIEGPGPIFFGETGRTLITRWADDPRSKIQWKLMIWAFSAQFFEDRETSKEKAVHFVQRCTSLEHARAAAMEVGILVGPA